MTGPGRTAGIGWSTRWERWIVIGLTAVVLVPILLSIVKMLGGPTYYPGIDIAATELRVRDALGEAVLVGPYSRYGWDHPGPFLFYLLAIPYWLSGRASISLPITAALVNAASVVGCVTIGWRRLGVRGALGVLGPVALMVRAMGPEQIRDPWNPYLPVLPLLFFVLAMWCVAERDWWWGVAAALVGSFVVQTHVGFALVVGATALVGLGLGIRRARTENGSRRWWPAAVVSGVALAVVWFPVAYGRFVRDDGNLSRLYQFFSADHATAGWTRALEIMGLQWGVAPEWVLGGRSTAGRPFPAEPRWYLAVGIVAVILGIVVAWRRGDRVVTSLGWLAVVAVIAATVSVSQVVGPMWPYIVRWTWVPGVLLAVVAVLGLVPLVARRHRPVAVAVAGFAIVVLGVGATVRVARVDAPAARRSAIERSLSDQVLRNLPRGSGSVMIDRTESTFAVPGLMLQLERHGFDTVVTPPLEIVYGERRSRAPEEIRARLVVIDGDAAAPVPGRKIASYRSREAGVSEHIDVYLVPPPGASGGS